MDKSERILIITDSVSMPSHQVRYEDTWIYLFKQRFKNYDVIDRPAKGSTSMRLVHEGGGGEELLELYMPDRIILQLGLAECAPRLFKKKGFERKFINSYLPAGFRNRYVRAVKKRRIRNPHFTDVSPDRFRKNLVRFSERCLKHNVRLYIITILRPTDLFVIKSPFVGQNIDLWNSIYREVASGFSNITIIDPVNPEIDVNSLCFDELHINSKGQKLYFEAVEKFFTDAK